MEEVPLIDTKTFMEFLELSKTISWFIRIRVIHVLNANPTMFYTKNSKGGVFITAQHVKNSKFTDSLNGNFVVV